MTISSATAFAARTPLPTREVVPPPEDRARAQAAQARNDDAEKAATKAAKEAVERPTPPAPSSRAPLVEAAGKLVDKLI